jgi:hypothetical protein
MQDTWLVTPDGGVRLSDVPIRIFDGADQAGAAAGAASIAGRIR